MADQLSKKLEQEKKNPTDSKHFLSIDMYFKLLKMDFVGEIEK